MTIDPKESVRVTFRSDTPYVHERIRAAAMYCSDGRVGQHFDEFLHEGLGLPRYDRIALPGGPACLAGHIKAHFNEQAVADELRFLVEAHGVTRVVLIAHQNCAFYGSRLNIEEDKIEAAQKVDLAKAARFVYRLTGLTQVDCFFSRINDGHIDFELVPVDTIRPF